MQFAVQIIVVNVPLYELSIEWNSNERLDIVENSETRVLKQCICGHSLSSTVSDNCN